MFKFLCIIALVAASASAHQIACQDCKSAIDALSKYLIGEKSLAKQNAILIAKYCPTTSDPDHCEADVLRYWPGAAQVLYGIFFIQKEPCGPKGLDVCKSATFRDLTCQECTDSMNKLSGIMTTYTYFKEAVEYLSGPAHCGEMAQPEYCAQRVAEIIPPVFAILGQATIDQIESICKDVIGACYDFPGNS